MVTLGARGRVVIARALLAIDKATVAVAALDRAVIADIEIDQRMTKGSSILASFSVWASPSHLKALVVYSAECLAFLRLNCGYLPRLAKKLEKAVCK